MLLILPVQIGRGSEEEPNHSFLRATTKLETDLAPALCMVTHSWGEILFVCNNQASQELTSELAMQDCLWP